DRLALHAARIVGVVVEARGGEIDVGLLVDDPVDDAGGLVVGVLRVLLRVRVAHQFRAGGARRDERARVRRGRAVGLEAGQADGVHLALAGAGEGGADVVRDLAGQGVTQEAIAGRVVVVARLRAAV